MGSVLFSIFVFVVAISVLIAFHEFGHFWVARRLGVKVLRFSIGFGKPFLRYKDKYQTEYVVAAIPLGGYVKMLDENEGDVDEAELKYAFNRKPVWSRIAIVAAGPIFNILLAIMAFWLMFIIGVSSVAPVIGKVMPDTAVSQAGFHRGEEILEVSGENTPNWRAVRLALMSHVGSKEPLKVKVKSIETDEFKTHYLTLNKSSFADNKVDPLQTLGFSPYVPKIPPVIFKVHPDTPAKQAGLEKGDRIVKLDNTKINDWFQFVTLVQAHKKGEIKLQVSRNGKYKTLSITPEISTVENREIKFLGVQSEPINWPKNMMRQQKYSVIGAFWPACKESYRLVLLTFKVLGKMLLGHISWQNLSGPIGIAQLAGQTADIGFTYFLGFLGLLSIGLGVLNILPIPMLDGGHLLYYFIEIIRGRPISIKTQEMGMKIGIVFLVGLMFLAIFNDISRLIT